MFCFERTQVRVWCASLLDKQLTKLAFGNYINLVVDSFTASFLESRVVLFRILNNNYCHCLLFFTKILIFYFLTLPLGED
jgi:hypothetical protein